MFPKTQRDIEELVSQAVQTGRHSFTFASYMRVTLAYHSCKGFLLVLTPMPEYCDMAREFEKQREVHLATMCVLVAGCINHSYRDDGTPLVAPGTFGEDCVEPCVIEGCESSCYAYSWRLSAEAN